MPHHFECQEDLLIGIYGNEKGEQSIKESIRVSQIDLSNRLYQLATRKNASAALVLSLYQKYKAIEKILYDDDYIKSGLLGSSAIQWAECFANVGNNDMAFDILNQELSRMKEIAECKLTSFSYLVPAYISKQIEEKDMTERCSDLYFSANDYLSYLEKHFTNSIKNDHRYNQYVFELHAFIDKYTVN